MLRLICASLLLVSVSLLAQPEKDFVLLDPVPLAAAKNMYQRHQVHAIAISRILVAAEETMQMQPLSVTDNEPLPVSGNKNDYFSVGPYWWPDPDKEDGLPWIKRDGEVNRAMRGEDSDSQMLKRLINATRVLALAYYFSDDKKYAEKAKQLLHHWFINPDTAMNPHLNYAQSIPGRTYGRGIGIIDIRLMPHLLDSLTLLKSYSDPTFYAPMEEWLTIFLGWLVESKNGQDEAAMHNNHGTFYDVITLSLALHLGFKDMAENILQVSKTRITKQIDSKGAQAHELKRTRPFHYSAYNLLAFVQLATMAEKVEVDLWRYPSADDPRIYRAYRYLMDNLTNKKLFSGSQEAQPNKARLVGLALPIYHQFADAEALFLVPQWPDSAQVQGQQCALLASFPLLLDNTDTSSRILCEN